MAFQLISTFLPLLLVAVLATLNVLNAGDGDGGPDLENSIAISLTVVFVLPGLRSVQYHDHNVQCSVGTLITTHPCKETIKCWHCRAQQLVHFV